MYIKSPYPNPSPLPPTNAYNFLYNRDDQKQWKDFTAHIDSLTGKKKLFSELKADVQELGTALGAPTSQGGLGLNGDGGEMIGIMGENSSEYITMIQSLLMITIPFAPISSYSTSFELKHALKLSKATRVFVDARFLPLMLRVAKEVGISLDKIYILRGHVKARKSVQDLIFTAWKNKIPLVGVRLATKDTLAYLVFSSGTTGMPKAVMISHGNIICSMVQSMIVGKVTATFRASPPLKTPEGIPVTLAFLPLHHSYGINVYSLLVMLVPNTLVIMSKWNIDTVLQLIPKYRISVLTLIPSVIVQLVNHPKTRQTDLSSLGQVVCGAAYLPRELANKLASFLPAGVSVREGYGLSESTQSALGQPIPRVLGIHLPAGSAGVLQPGIEARIVKDDGGQAGVGEVGEMWLKGETVALGYWGDEKAMRETFVDGWLHTGDKFWVDKKGHFLYVIFRFFAGCGAYWVFGWIDSFADRAKDTLKVSGEQVSPVEIENVLLSHPKKLISDVTVAGVSGRRTSGEKVPRAWIVLSDSGKELGSAAVVKELDAWHRQSLSKYKWLRGGIEVVREIPKLPTGKVLRRVLQDEYEKQNSRKVITKL
ncbi:hypothetical protein BDQ17DRAFT_1419276 [Cyathus striatus]|nr:hypothetical protein BDQ17DRAFT_1419276 [Cyathus striatus]